MSKPATGSPQNALADVEQRILAAAREREALAAEPGRRDHTGRG